MPSSSLLFQTLLAFSHATIMLPLLLGGLIWEMAKGRTRFPIWKAACLLALFSMILNAFLKSLFLVPLSPVLGKEGFAFPSGHMQVSTAFYGWLFWAYAHWFVRGFILLILAGIGYGLVHEGYHNVSDVVAGVIAAAATVYIFICLLRIPWFQKNPARLGLWLIPLAAMMMVFIGYRIGVPPPITKTFLGLSVFSALMFWLGKNHDA